MRERKNDYRKHGTSHMAKMAATVIYVKRLENSSSANQRADCLENWYVESWTLLL